MIFRLIARVVRRSTHWDGIPSIGLVGDTVGQPLARCYASHSEVAMLGITKDIQSLTNFRRKSAEFLKKMKKSKRPVVLTVNGKAEAVLQDAECYQRLLDSAARADVCEAVRQGVDDIVHGRTRPARKVLNQLRRGHGVSR
jgi:prevent-host-death family protein